MKVDKELIEHVAKISRLKLTEAEIKEFLPQLSEILGAFSKLQKIDVSKIKPSYHPIDIIDVYREDEIGQSMSNEEALKNTKNSLDGFFKGPKVL